MKSILKKLLHGIGYHVQPLERYSGHRLCGLRNIPFRTIIDAGANRGQSAQWMLRNFPHATIHSFEPVPDTFAYLARMAMDNPRHRAINAALGIEAGTVAIHVHQDHDPSSSLLPVTETCKILFPFVSRQQHVNINVTTLDAYVDGLPEPPIDPILIKLDVQGYEARVIQGGGTLFNRAAAVLCEISLAPLYEGQPDFHDIDMLLRRHGLRFAGCAEQYLDKDGKVLFLDAVYLRD